MRLKFFPDAPEGGAPQTAEQINRPQTGQIDPPEPEVTPTAGDAPPAATIVVNSPKDERETNLEVELQKERDARKKAETDAAHLADENQRLKELRKLEKSDRPAKRRGGFGFFPGED